MRGAALQWLAGGGALWVFSALVHALPEPLPMGSRWYLFLYNLAHALGANLDRLKGRAEKTAE